MDGEGVLSGEGSGDSGGGTRSEVTIYWGGTVGLVFMSVVALALLVALLRSEARMRDLLRGRASQSGEAVA